MKMLRTLLKMLGRVRVRWWIFAYMFAFAFMSYVQRSSLSVAAEKIMPALHLSKVQIGSMMWAFTVAYTLFQIPGGALGQRFGARAAYFAVGIVGFVAVIATPLAPLVLGGLALFVVLLLAQAVLGMSQGPVFPVFAGVVEAWFPVSRWSLANGLQTAGMNIGAAATPPLIVLLERAFGWQGALLWIGVPTLLLALSWLWYGRNRPREHRSVTPQELGELGELAGEVSPPLTLKRLLRVAADRDVLLLAVSYLCMNYAFYLLQNWSFLYLIDERHFTSLAAGFLAMLPPIGAAVGSALGGVLGDYYAQRYGARRGYRLAPLIALPTAGGLLLLAAHVDSAYAAVAALALAYGAVEVTEGPYWAATMRVARADTMAATGVLNTGGNLGGVVGIPIVTYFWNNGAWTAAFATGTVFAVVAAGLWLLVDPERHPASHVPG
jgi:ACS family glucarate transporter-like MFS transporter